MEKIAPDERAVAVGWARIMRRRSGISDSVSSTSETVVSQILLALANAEFEEDARVGFSRDEGQGSYTHEEFLAEPKISPRYSGIPKAAAYSGINAWPAVWYM